jgi:hypothetical protein
MRESKHLTPELWQQIEAMREAGIKPRQIADRLGISYFSIMSGGRAVRPVSLPDRPRPKIVPENYPPAIRAALETPVAELDIPPRLRALLDRLGLLFVHQLLAVSADDLRAVHGVNEASMAALFQALAKIGLHRSEPPKPKRKRRELVA